jgi:HNH endonuclease
MDDIKILYETTELTIQQIADATNHTFKQTFSYIARTYPRDLRVRRKKVCYRNSKLGSKNPAFGLRGEDSTSFIGAVSDNKGYLMVLKPIWYTGRANSKHVFEHHVVVCLALGISEIPKGWCVHHCNMITTDNCFDNLVLVLMSDHMRLHHYLAGATTISKESTLKWVEAHGTPWRDDIVCSA